MSTIIIVTILERVSYAATTVYIDTCDNGHLSYIVGGQLIINSH